tara:strand:+ start:604 stop:792 length:189 start_codon:yes stop_codon:yes gene_type:complete
MAMGMKGAISELKRQAEFFGLTFEEVCTFIERNPYAHTERATMALGVYKNMTRKQVMQGGLK